LQDWLTDTAKEITTKALALAKHAKRKTITKADIKLAV
ncbi:MAG: histone-like protein, partial [Candidatus Helarchaeota archaeon]